jgi:hypothetical protein
MAVKACVLFPPGHDCIWPQRSNACRLDWRNYMPKKIVDAFDKYGQVFASYPITLDIMNMPIYDEDFIQEEKKCLEEDCLSPLLVEKWFVRDPRPDEA